MARAAFNTTDLKLIAKALQVAKIYEESFAEANTPVEGLTTSQVDEARECSREDAAQFADLRRKVLAKLQK